MSEAEEETLAAFGDGWTVRGEGGGADEVQVPGWGLASCRAQHKGRGKEGLNLAAAGRARLVTCPTPPLSFPAFGDLCPGQGLFCTSWFTSCPNRCNSAAGTIRTGPFRSQGSSDLTCALSPALAFTLTQHLQKRPAQVPASCLGVEGQGLG